MKRAAIPIVLTLLGGWATAERALAQGGFTVVPFEFDPFGTHLVAAAWKGGLGCPTNATTRPFNPNPPFNLLGPTPYTDPACPSGDSKDQRVQGLLLAKTGPTNNDASAGAVIQGVQGTHLFELGYDLRKPGPPLPTGVSPTPGVNPTPFPGDPNDPRGSHCGAGAPRFNIVTFEDPGVIFFLACNSPPPDMDNSGLGGGWQRLRWGGSVPLLAFGSACPDPNVPCDIRAKTVKSLSIVFDEAQDTGPDDFGLAVLDNIDVNGTLVGSGPGKPEDNDRDEGQGEDTDHDHFQFHDSPSRPESSNLSYEDRAQGVNVQAVNGARSVTYNGACVTFLGDALVNQEPGYVVTFVACDLSVLGLGIGNLSIAVTGPEGFLYQKSTALTSGYVSIHPR